MPFFSKIKQRVVHILSCCDKDDETPVRALEIGPPTNFHRVDTIIPGLTAEQSAQIYGQARYDAERMIAGLPPSPNPDTTTFPPNTLPRPLAPPNPAGTPQTSELVPLVPQHPLSPSGSTFDKVRQHTRRLSQRFGFPQDSPYGNNDNSTVGMAITYDAVPGYDKVNGFEKYRDDSRRQSYDSAGFEERGNWTGRDSVTLGGSDKGDFGDKGFAVVKVM